MNPEKIAAVVFLVTLMLHTGLEVNISHLTAVLKDYGLLARAFLANFVIVPLLGIAAVRLFQLSDPVATGLLLMAISPGVPFVILAGGRAKGGSLGLAVSLAFLMPLLSVVTVPITARLVLPLSGEISTTTIVVSLGLFQLLPLVLGMIVCARAPGAAEKIRKPVAILALIAAIALLVILGGTIVKDIASTYGSRGMMAAAAITIVSFLVGWACGGSERGYRRTLGAGTALRNIGLAAAASTVFVDRAVGAEVISYLIIQFAIVSIVGVFFKRTAGESGTAASA